MKRVTDIVGTMAPLPRSHVDTDQIIPKQFLKRVERTGFGQYLFYDWAHDHDGNADPDFVLNRPEHRSATVLVTGPNFGTGSSREHAPWALADWGFRAIVAPSFGDIFRNNCHKVGLLTVELPAEVTTSLLELARAQPAAEISIDVNRQVVTAPGVEAGFGMDPYVKRMLTHGLDEVGLTLENESQISRYEMARPAHKPVL